MRRFFLSMALFGVLLPAGCKTIIGPSNGHTKLTVPVPFGPPPPKSERPPATQKAGYFWVPGYWEWLDIAGTYRWRPGHFVRARRDWVYHRASYRKIKGQWYFTRPYWRRRRHRPPTPKVKLVPGRTWNGALAAPPPAKKKRPGAAPVDRGVGGPSAVPRPAGPNGPRPGGSGPNRPDK